MYKIAVFSDIHGNNKSLEAILKDTKNKYDEVICLGDIIGVGPCPKECFDLMIESNTKWILGNHDLYFVKGIELFKVEAEKLDSCKWTVEQIPEDYKNKIDSNLLQYRLEIDGHTFTFCHYFMKDDDETYPFYGIGKIKKLYINDLTNMIDTEYIIYGHDHKPQQYNFNNKYLIDVGSSGCVKGNKTFYTVIEIDKNVKIYKKELLFDREEFDKILDEKTFPKKDEIINKFFR